MRFRIFLLGWVFLGCGWISVPSVCAQQVEGTFPLPSDSVEEITQIIKRSVRSWSDGNLSYAFLWNGRISGLGAEDASRRIHKGDTSFLGRYKATLGSVLLVRAASLGKPLVALGVLRLVQEGKFTLQTPLRELLPDLQLINPWEKESPLRLIHLLEHTGGIFGERFSDFLAQKHEQSQSMLDNVGSLRIRLENEPGGCTAYSNMGYALLGAIIERYSGQRFEDYLEEAVLLPLGLQFSTFSADKAEEHNLRSMPEPAGANRDRYFLRPAMEFRTSSGDLLRILQVLAFGKDLESDFHLDDSLWQHFFHTQTSLAARSGLAEGYSCGLQVTEVQGEVAIGHTAYLQGARGAIWVFPRLRSGYALISHNPPHLLSSLEESLRQKMLASARGIVPVAQPLSPNQLPPSGYYAVANPRNHDFRLVAFLMGGVRVAPYDGGCVIRTYSNKGRYFKNYVEGDFRNEFNLNERMTWGVLPSGDAWIMAGADFYVQANSLWPYVWVVLLLLTVLGQGLVFLIGLERGFLRWILRQETGPFRITPLWIQSSAFVLLALNFLRFSFDMGGELNTTTVSLLVGSLLYGLMNLSVWFQVVRSKWKRKWKVLGVLFCVLNTLVTGLLWAFGLMPVVFF